MNEDSGDTEKQLTALRREAERIEEDATYSSKGHFNVEDTWRVATTGWVAEVLRLTRLAPDIVQAILEGRQPRHLNLHAVRGRQAGVPVDRQEQRVIFGWTE